MDQTRTAPADDIRPAPHETVQVLELDADGEPGGDWITRLLSSGLFRNLPPEHSHRFFAELEPVSVRAGEVVVGQGELGAHFYVVTQGRCAVTRQVPSSNRELQLYVLRDGDTFGEAAILSGAPRTTTVRMLGDGVIMRLDGARFQQLVAAPMLSSVSHDEARRLVEGGAVWLDVRQNDQRSTDVFDGSLNVPAHVLSIEATQLDSTKTYVVYCENGAHSATGAFLLTRLGFDAHVLEGGLARLRTMEVEAEPAAADVEVEEPDTRENPEPEQATGADNASHRVPAHQAPDEDGAAGLRAALATLVKERDGAIAAAGQAQERARVLDQHNAALMSLIGVQRDKHRAIERKLESAREDQARRIDVERQSFLRKLRNLRRELQEMRRDGARVVRQIEEDRDAKANAVREAEARVAQVLETARFIENERSLLEQLLSQCDARLMQANAELSETREQLVESDRARSHTTERLQELTERHTAMRANLSASDARLSQAIDRLADANQRLTTTTLQLIEANGKLSTAELRRSGIDGQLAETRSRLTRALSEKAEAQAARQQAESALEAALDELRGQILGLAMLRSGLSIAPATG